MMKKNDVIQRLNAGGRILVDSIYRRAQVCDASGENWESMRYDVAERLQHEAGYKVVKTDWYASWYIEKEAQEVTAAEAAEKEIEEFAEFVNLLDSEDSAIVPFDVVREIWANASSIKRAVSNVHDYAETIRAEWVAESERVEAATLAALAPMIASQEAPEAQQEPEKELTPYERVTAKNPDCPNAWRLPGYPGPVYTIQYKDARGGWYSCHYPSFQEYRDDLERILRDGGQIEKTTKTEAGQEEELEELKETQENAEPVYLEERWPESNEEPCVWYSIEWPAGLPTIYHTVSDFRTAVHQARHNGRHIEAAWRHDWRNAGNVGTRRAIIPETSQEKTDRENRAHCQSIARNVELYAYGNAWKCPHCGEVNHLDDIYQEDRENEYICPDCGEILDRDELENLTLYDYFSDCLDIEYRCGSDREYRSACIMIACGGPNIYIDTATKNVELYWWTDRATYPLSYDAAEAVDDWAREYWECI